MLVPYTPSSRGPQPLRSLMRGDIAFHQRRGRHGLSLAAATGNGPAHCGGASHHRIRRRKRSATLQCTGSARCCPWGSKLEAAVGSAWPNTALWHQAGKRMRFQAWGTGHEAFFRSVLSCLSSGFLLVRVIVSLRQSSRGWLPLAATCDPCQRHLRMPVGTWH